MKRFYLLLMVVIGLIALPSVLGATDCFINLTSSDINFINVGKVSLQGHFTANPASLFAYNLWCPSSWPFGNGSTSFTFAVSNASSNGSNHVGLVNAFNGEVLLGFQDSCYVRQSACLPEESCIFKTNGTNNTHVADCNKVNFPMANSFDYPVCCQLTEICNNGVDDDEDGFMDCADSDCYGVPLGATPPEECTGSPMNTTYCTGPQNATCIGQPPENDTTFYCSYGVTDDPSGGHPGVCCPIGYFAEWVNFPAPGRWVCTPTDECGLDLGVGEFCEFDYDSQTDPWLSATYTGDPNYWCNSQIPDLYSPTLSLPERSTGCCLVQKYGAWDYYLDEDNVKIYG